MSRSILEIKEKSSR